MDVRKREDSRSMDSFDDKCLVAFGIFSHNKRCEGWLNKRSREIERRDQ